MKLPTSFCFPRYPSSVHQAVTLGLLLSTLSFDAQANQRSVLEAAIIGGVTGGVSITIYLIYIWIFQPLYKKYIEPTRKRSAEKSEAVALKKRETIEASLPRIVLLSANGDAEGVAALLDQGVSVDEVGPNGQSALMLAVRNAHTEVIDLLLERGANPNLKSNSGSTALDIARTYKRGRAELQLLAAPYSAKSGDD